MATANLNGLDFEIPEGYRNIDEENLVQKGDRVAAVVCTYAGKDEKLLNLYPPQLSWLQVDESEIGKIKKYCGKVVIRKGNYIPIHPKK